MAWRRLLSYGSIILATVASGCTPVTEVSSPTAETPPPGMTLSITEPPPTRQLPTDTHIAATSTPSTVAATEAPPSTATLGTPVTRTPGQPEACPSHVGDAPALTSDAPGKTVAEIFEPQLLDYLNSVGSASGLEAALSGLTMLDGAWQARTQLETVDVTGNTTADVVLGLTFFEEGQYSEGALFVFRCEGGQYVGEAIISVWGQVLSKDDPDGLRAVQDLNMDGVPEIVYSHIAIAGTHVYFMREFFILEWDGQNFVDLIPLDPNFGHVAQVDSGDGTLRDTDQDGTVELVLTSGLGLAYPDLGPQRKRSDIWSWDGYAFNLNRWEFTAPEFRIHAVWDGDDATVFGEYDTALAFYQQAIFDEELFGWSSGRFWPDREYAGSPTPTPDPEERPRLSAYSRYRIMLLHLVQGYQTEAQIVYETLQEKFPTGTVGLFEAEVATVFWDAFSKTGDMGMACEEARAYAADHTREILTFLGRRFYGSGQREYTPEDICPFE